MKRLIVFVACSVAGLGAAVLAELPLVKANILTFDLIPVGPLMPLRVLLKPQP